MNRFRPLAEVDQVDVHQVVVDGHGLKEVAGVVGHALNDRRHGLVDHFLRLILQLCKSKTKQQQVPWTTCLDTFATDRSIFSSHPMQGRTVRHGPRHWTKIHFIMQTQSKAAGEVKDLPSSMFFKSFWLSSVNEISASSRDDE